jgi:hypothetical protein
MPAPREQSSRTELPAAPALPRRTDLPDARFSSVRQVTGSWLPLPGAQPFNGQVGVVQQAVRDAHPYEEPVIRFLPLYEP